MPIQAPQWTDYLNCPACCREFAPSRSPISLGCGHTLCRLCLKNLHRKQCPFDQTVISVDLDELVVNTALLQLAGYSPPAQPYHPPSIQSLSEQDRHAYDTVVKSLEQLAVFLKFCGNANNVPGSRLSRPMQRKLVTLLQCAMTDEEGRGKAARAARSLGDRTVTELIVQHQNPQQLSANLWAAVRSRGCQFLGPAMQEEVLKLVLLALEDGSALSRKVLVMFVVQRLEPHFPQASKTSIGHVVQLLYRASCFKVSKRVCDSSLMQLKEEFRTYETLRREHDGQIVQIATEAGLRIAPDQWSALLYGDTQHKSHMQSIIDKLQTPQSFAQSVQELFITLQRTGDPAQLIAMSIPLDRLANIDASPDAKSPTWQQLSAITTALKEVVSGLVHFMQHHANGRDNNHNPKIMERQPETASQPSSMQGLPGRYKVAMCRDAQTRTYCPRGNNCTYAHSEDELERYRRINSAVNNQYMMQPLIAVSRPIYQRFSVPPPPLPTMDNNYNMPPMQQQISPSPRRPIVGVEAMDREQPYEHEREKVFELTREPTYEHQRERSFEHREQPYDVAREKPYDISHETSFELTREPTYEHQRERSFEHREQPYDVAREQPYDISHETSFELTREPTYEHQRERSFEHREQPYEVAREQPYDITCETSFERTHEPPYDITREQYDITCEQSYDRAREPPFDHPPPNVSADNYVTYANALLHGGTDNMARSATQSTNQNGSVNTMLPPPGRYYPRYLDRPTYPYMAPIDAGRINNDEMSQYQGMGGIRPAPNHDYSPIEYPQQQTYIDEDGSEMHYDPLSFGISVSRPVGSAHTQPQDAAWPTNNQVKCQPMFKFDKRAKNLPIGMEIGKSMPIGIEMPKNVPIGREMKKNMAIGMDIGNNIPIGMEMPKNVPIGNPMGTINLPIGMDIQKNMPIGIDMQKNMPIGIDMQKNMPIGMEMAGNTPIGMEKTGNMPIGMEMAKKMPNSMPQTTGEMVHYGLERMKPKLRTVNEKREDQELEKELKALEKRMSSEFSKVDPGVDAALRAAQQQAQH